MLKSKAFTAIALTMLLILIISASFVTIQPVKAAFDAPTAAAKAAGMTWPPPGLQNADLNASANRLEMWNRYKDKVPTFVAGVLSPTPVGLGQQESIIMYNFMQPPDALIENDIRYQYTLEITKPSGAVVKLPSSGTFTSDATGSTFTLWTVDEVGNWTVKVNFLELFFKWYAGYNPPWTTETSNDYYGTTFLASSKTYRLVVQEEPVTPVAPAIQPMPTEYWTRPIDGQNTPWYTVASNWLGNAHDQSNIAGGQNRYQQDGIGPNSGHILWTKATEDGGLVGGGNFSTPGDTFNAGHQYQTRFTNPLIMWGRLYYEESWEFNGFGGDYVCVDLRTGQEVWRNKRPVEAVPSFGYYYDWDTPNDHGIMTPGWLWTDNFETQIQPRYGYSTSLRITNVPSGWEMIGQHGENLRLVMMNAGNATNPNWYLAQWNSSRVFTFEVEGSLVANVPITPAAPAVLPPPFDSFMSFGFFGPQQQCAWGWTGSSWAIFDTANNMIVDTAATTAGNLVDTTTEIAGTNNLPCYDWNVSIPFTNSMNHGLIPSGFGFAPNVRIVAADQNDVAIIVNGSNPSGTNSQTYLYPEQFTMAGVSLKPGSEGSLLWGPTTIQTHSTDNKNLMFERGGQGTLCFIQMPTLDFVGYDMHTGQKLWTTPPEAEVNAFGYFGYVSLMHVFATHIAYGNLYTCGYTGHVNCYDLKTGVMKWSFESPTNRTIFRDYTLFIGTIADGKVYVGTHEHSADTPLFKGAHISVLNATTGDVIWQLEGWAHPQTMIIADATLIYWDNYNHEVHAIAKGPSAMTVEAPSAGVTQGNSLVVRGTVMDISPGTKQTEQAARFPNGVPAVSEASMGTWMSYVYMQKERPIDATGVPVSIDVMDANNNFRNIGTATTDSNGVFSLEWKPDIPGKFTVYASFAGSESYWPSNAVTAFTADPAPEATVAPTSPPASIADQYFLPMSIGIIIAIAVVGAILALLLLRKR